VKKSLRGLQVIFIGCVWQITAIPKDPKRVIVASAEVRFQSKVIRKMRKRVQRKNFPSLLQTVLALGLGKAVWVHPSFWCKSDFLLFIMDEYQVTFCRS